MKFATQLAPALGSYQDLPGDRLPLRAVLATTRPMALSGRAVDFWFHHSQVRILAPQPASQVSATRFPGAAEVSTFQRVWPIRASLCRPVHRSKAREKP